MTPRERQEFEDICKALELTGDRKLLVQKFIERVEDRARAGDGWGGWREGYEEGRATAGMYT